MARATLTPSICGMSISNTATCGRKARNIASARAVFGFAHQLQAGFGLDDFAQPFAENRVVIGNEDGDFVAHTFARFC